MSYTEQDRNALIAAFENPNYQWRTIRGAAREAGLSPDVALEILSDIRDVVVQSSIPSTDGDDLYTTRSHYKEFASAGKKFLAALKNRAE
jgi:hypothetical protein